MNNQPSSNGCAQPQSSCTLPQSSRDPKGLFCWCSTRVICFFAVLLAFTLGLILGAVFSTVILSALPSIIVVAVILAVIVIGLLIFRRCLCCRSRKCE